jgi:hypothetical protein
VGKKEDRKKVTVGGSFMNVSSKIGRESGGKKGIGGFEMGLGLRKDW